MFNAGAHFMATNPIVKVIEPILAIGFMVHIFTGTALTLQNRKARGKQRYASGNKTKNIFRVSKNMFILGFALFAFLVLHLSHFWLKIKFTGSELLSHVYVDIAGTPVYAENAYALVNDNFSRLWVVIVYTAANIALGLHLSHGVWSGFQTVGFGSQSCLKRLKRVAVVFACLVATGFSVIAAGQYLFFQ